MLPWNWLVDFPAAVIRFPFAVLRAAGLPPKVEENIISHALKVVFALALAAGLTYLGLQEAAPGILKDFFGK